MKHLLEPAVVLDSEESKRIYSPKLTFLSRRAFSLGWKRLFDVTVASAGALFLAPSFLVAVCWIKVTSEGPVLFKQERVGLGGQHFTMFKFRSMEVGADTGAHEDYVRTLIDFNLPMEKLDATGDSRLIFGGRLLRASCLDELPQLWNVIRGEMSLVGPRPCIPAELERFSTSEQRRFDAKPGMTGLWQVNGKNKTTFRRMVALDILYLKRRSVWFDLNIIAKTVPAILELIEESRQNSKKS